MQADIQIYFPSRERETELYEIKLNIVEAQFQIENPLLYDRKNQDLRLNDYSSLGRTHFMFV